MVQTSDEAGALVRQHGIGSNCGRGEPVKFGPGPARLNDAVACGSWALPYLLRCYHDAVSGLFRVRGRPVLVSEIGGVVAGKRN